MPLDIANYRGREQAYVKHYFLAGYLERLIFKLASAYEEVVYIDGYSGPWQNNTEEFEDTSFGIALRALTRAKHTWATMSSPAQRRSVRVTAHLVERDPAAFARLADLQKLFPEVRIIPHQGDFAQIAPAIVNDLSPRSFSFVFVDPKGWSVDLTAIQPLIGRDNCEVVFNFMFDFINRFALSDDPGTAAQLDRLIPGRDWRACIRAIDAQDRTVDEESRASARKAALIDEFKSALAVVGNYQFVADIDVLRPTLDRTLYFLVYATRRPPGIAVFRDCHVASLKEQSMLRGRRKLEGRQERSGQFELLASASEMGPDRSSVSLASEECRARDLLLEFAPTSEAIRWDALWPKVLSRCVIRLTDLKRIANEHRRSGALLFPGWPAGAKRVPDDNYLVCRRHSSKAQGVAVPTSQQ